MLTNTKITQTYWTKPVYLWLCDTKFNGVVKILLSFLTCHKFYCTDLRVYLRFPHIQPINSFTNPYTFFTPFSQLDIVSHNLIDIGARACSCYIQVFTTNTNNSM